MKVRKINLPYVLMVMFLSLTIIGYNLWSYSCGYCTLASLMTLSPPAIILIACNLLAVAGLVAIRLRNRRQVGRNHCACGEPLRSSWGFCPACGQARRE